VPPDDYAQSDIKVEKKKKKPSPFFLAAFWDLNVPMGSTTDFVKKVDPAGFGIEGRYHGLVKAGPGNLGVGILVSWDWMAQKSESSLVEGNVTLTGTQVRELSVTPLMGKVIYTFDQHKRFHPYVGFGLGPARVWRRLDIGIYRYLDESWHFAMAPELGLEIPLRNVVGLVAARVNYLVQTKDDPQQLYLNFSVGLGFH